MRGAKVQPFFEFAKLFEKIVLIASFCTALRMPKCSHRSTMLRFHPLAWHKISPIPIISITSITSIISNASNASNALNAPIPPH